MKLQSILDSQPENNVRLCLVVMQGLSGKAVFIGSLVEANEHRSVWNVAKPHLGRSEEDISSPNDQWNATHWVYLSNVIDCEQSLRGKE